MEIFGKGPLPLSLYWIGQLLYVLGGLLFIKVAIYLTRWFETHERMTHDKQYGLDFGDGNNRDSPCDWVWSKITRAGSTLTSGVRAQIARMQNQHGIIFVNKGGWVFLHFAPPCLALSFLFVQLEATSASLNLSEEAQYLAEHELGNCSTAPEFYGLEGLSTPAGRVSHQCYVIASQIINVLKHSNDAIEKGILRLSWATLLAVVFILESPLLLFSLGKKLSFTGSREKFCRRCQALFLFLLFDVGYITRFLPAPKFVNVTDIFPFTKHLFQFTRQFDSIYSTLNEIASLRLDFSALAVSVISPLNLNPERYVSAMLPYVSQGQRQELFTLVDAQSAWLYMVAGEGAILVVCIWEVLKENVLKPVMKDGFWRTYF